MLPCMDTVTLGPGGPETSRICYGCMSLPEADDPDAALDAAREQGITLFDHADIYGTGESEAIFGRWLAERPALRDSIIVQSKCGIRFAGEPDDHAPHRFDFSYQHIVDSVEGSLRRLATDSLDVLLLHRPDALCDPDEVARAFDHLHGSGKVRHFGVSNHSLHRIELLRSHIDQPLVANQIEISLMRPQPLAAGMRWNTAAEAINDEDGTVDYCRRHQIRVQAWSPLARGRLSGASPRPKHDPDLERLHAACAMVAHCAEAHGCSADAIVLAWLLRHPAGVQPVIGSRDPARIAACCRAVDCALSREEWYRLLGAAEGEGLP